MHSSEHTKDFHLQMNLWKLRIFKVTPLFLYSFICICRVSQSEPNVFQRNDSKPIEKVSLHFYWCCSKYGWDGAAFNKSDYKSKKMLTPIIFLRSAVFEGFNMSCSQFPPTIISPILWGVPELLQPWKWNFIIFSVGPFQWVSSLVLHDNTAAGAGGSSKPRPACTDANIGTSSHRYQLLRGRKMH